MIHIVPSASTWSRARHSGLAGQHPLLSRSSPLGLSSLSLDDSDKIHHAHRELEIIAWVAEQALHCPSKIIGLTLIFPEDLGGHVSDGPSSFVGTTGVSFPRGHTLRSDVLLATCASSRERTTSVRLEFSPTVSIFETVCPWVGLLSNKSKTDLCTRAPSHAAILPLLVSRKTPRFGLRRLLGSVLVSGAHVSTTIHWKGDSIPLGMAIKLISLLWASLHSSHRLWHPVLLLCGLRTTRGKQVLCRDRRSQISRLQTLLQPISPSLLGCLPLARLCAPC